MARVLRWTGLPAAQAAKAITGAHCNGFLFFRPNSATSTAVRVGLPQGRPAW